MSEVLDKLNAVHDSASFIAFVEALAADRAETEAKEAERPTGVFDAPHNGWETATIAEFLASALDHADWRLRDASPSWQTFARFLFDGKIIDAPERHRRQAAARRAAEPEAGVVLRLDDETARLLYSVLTLLGEYHAAGAAIPEFPREVQRRLGALYDELGGQLGIQSNAEMMRRALVEKRKRQQAAASSEPDPSAAAMQDDGGS